MKPAFFRQNLPGLGHRSFLGKRTRAVASISRASAALNAAVVAQVESLENRLLFSVPAMGVNIRRLGPDSGDELFADAMKETNAWFLGSVNASSGAASVDSNGWPTSDASVTVITNSSNDGGTYALSFTGQATVSADPALPSLSVVNANYDSATNTTTASVIAPDGSHQVILDFTNTQRQPGDPSGTGITDVHLMRPTSVNSATSYSSSTLFSTPILNLLSKFSTIRYMDYSLTNSNTQVNWSDRTLPSQEQYNPRGGAWEYAVALANQTSNDMWINIPEMASDTYITKLAQLINYGSDGVNPYTGPEGSAVSSSNPNPVPASGPVWAGLNPSLHVYVEYSNEVWNTGFAQNQENQNAAVAEVDAGGSPLNFDGDTTKTDWAIRRTAERIVDTSNTFRDVFGGSEMITRVRPVYQWQYSNLNNTASLGLEFINNYYNNGDGLTHVASPHPVDYYLWGAGGGWYGGLSNPNGTGDVTIPDANFASPAVSDYEPDPTTSAWSFSGSAGIAANGSDLGNPVSTSGSQAAYIQGNGSFSETVNFTGGLADLTFNAATLGGESFTVSIDGNDATSAWTLGSAYSVQRTAVFDTGVSGPHTVTFTGNGGNGSVFISNVVAETVNGMYKSAIQNISATTQSESSWAAAFGLHMASYEGGFVFGTGTNGTPLQIDANQDIRAEAADIAQMDEFYSSGGDLAMYYETTNHIWALTLDINDQNTPKIDAVESVLAAPQPAVSYGIVLPSTTGSSVTVANTLGKYQGAAGLYPIRVTTPGTYTVVLTGEQTGTEKEHFLLDGQSIGTTMLATTSSGNSSPALTFTVTTPGLYAMLVTTTGTGSISQSNPAGAIKVTAGTGVGSTPSEKLAFTTPPPTSVTAGAVIGTSGIKVAVESSTGTVQGGDSSTITLTLHGGTFASGATTATAKAVGGVATFTGLIIDKAASYTLTASDSNTAVTSATSAAFKIIAGPAVIAHSIVTVSSSKVSLGATSIVTLQAKDVYGNNVTTGGLKVAFKLAGTGTSSGTLSAVTDHGNGTYTATFTATVPGTARQISATVNTIAVTTTLPTITISTTPITPKAVVFHATAGHSTTGTVATFSVPDLSAVVGNFTATIIWGDTQTSYPATIVRDSAGNFHVAGTHLYSTIKSNYAIKVTIHEVGGIVATITSTGVVTAAPLVAMTMAAMSATVNTTFTSKVVAEFQDNNSLHTSAALYTGTIAWGDGATSTAVFKWSSTTAGVATFWHALGTHKYTKTGTFTLTATVKEPAAGLTLTLKTVVHVVA